jgi:hypothetical protein
VSDADLERVRAIALALPETREKTEHRPAFVIRAKTFCWYMDNHHDDHRLALWVKPPPQAQQELVAADPDRFFVPPYVGPHGWVGLRLDRGDTDWAEVAELVEDSYRLFAPKRLLAALDQRRPG